MVVIGDVRVGVCKMNLQYRRIPKQVGVSENELLRIVDHGVEISRELLRRGLRGVVSVIAAEDGVVIPETMIETNAIDVTGNCGDTGKR